MLYFVSADQWAQILDLNKMSETKLNILKNVPQNDDDPEDSLRRQRILKFPMISGHVRSLSVENKKWNRHGAWKMDLVFFVDQDCEDKVHGSDGLKRAMIFLSVGQVCFF